MVHCSGTRVGCWQEPDPQCEVRCRETGGQSSPAVLLGEPENLGRKMPLILKLFSWIFHAGSEGEFSCFIATHPFPLPTSLSFSSTCPSFPHLKTSLITHPYSPPISTTHSSFSIALIIGLPSIGPWHGFPGPKLFRIPTQLFSFLLGSLIL